MVGQEAGVGTMCFWHKCLIARLSCTGWQQTLACPVSSVSRGTQTSRMVLASRRMGVTSSSMLLGDAPPSSDMSVFGVAAAAVRTGCAGVAGCAALLRHARGGAVASCAHSGGDAIWVQMSAQWPDACRYAAATSRLLVPQLRTCSGEAKQDLGGCRMAERDSN